MSNFYMCFGCKIPLLIHMILLLLYNKRTNRSYQISLAIDECCDKNEEYKQGADYRKISQTNVVVPFLVDFI